MNFTVPLVLGCIVNCALVTRRKLFLFWRPDVSLFKDWKSLKQHQRSNKQRISHDRQHLSFTLHFFSTYFFHILLLCTAIHFYFFPPKSSPHSCLCPLLSVFFILRGFSPFIHPDQVAIPYKAKGSPHLASYFPIRSVVTDRIYTGSSLECEAASPSAMPQTPLCSLLRSTNLVKPPLLPLLPLLFLQLL